MKMIGIIAGMSWQSRQTGLDVAVPHKNDRAEIHRIIYDELVLGEISC